MKKSKIYVCEHGNAHDGGRVIYASTSYKKVWLHAREIRLKSTKSYLNSHVFNFPFSNSELQAAWKNYWCDEDGYVYVRIHVFEE